MDITEGNGARWFTACTRLGVPTRISLFNPRRRRPSVKSSATAEHRPSPDPPFQEPRTPTRLPARPPRRAVAPRADLCPIIQGRFLPSERNRARRRRTRHLRPDRTGPTGVTIPPWPPRPAPRSAAVAPGRRVERDGDREPLNGSERSAADMTGAVTDVSRSRARSLGARR